MEETTEATLAELLVAQAPDAVIFADVGGSIRTWNAAAEAMFGYPAADALGKRLDIIVPEQFRQQHWAGYERALAAGDTKYRGQALPTRASRASGDTFYVELSFAIVHGTDGAVIGALAHARDITERFERDRANRRRLKELEDEGARLRGA